jgi:rod shape-determining protein MreB
VIIGIPTGVTEVEKRAVYDAAMAAGARQAMLVEEPIAAAIGAGLPIDEVRGSMVVDIGGGTTEVAVMSMSGVVASRSLRVAGDEMDQDVFQYLRNKYNLLIGQGVAEQIKINIGSAYPLPSEKMMEVRGRNLVTGLPETVEISSVEIREALSGSVQVIIDTVRDALDEIPPEMVSDLMDVGICMAGGGSLLQGFPDRISDELNLRVWLAEDPITCVCRGAARIYDNFDTLGRYLVGLERGSTRRKVY